MKHLSVIFLLFTLALVQCSGPDTVYEEHRYFENDTWHRFDKLNFAVPVDNIDKNYDIKFSMVYTSEYQYDRIPVHVIMNTPAGEERIHEFKFNVRNKAGDFIGEKKGDSIHLKKTLWGGFVFNKEGKAKLSIEQLIPKYNTPHIKSAGIMLKQTKD